MLNRFDKMLAVVACIGAVSSGSALLFLQLQPKEQVALSEMKVDLPSAIICLAKYETCTPPLSLLEVPAMVRWYNFREEGPQVFAENSPPYEAAIDYMAEEDHEGKPTWATVMMVAGF